MTTAGIHHVTAIAGEPRRNIAFWRETMGLRLVKKTVNFDDPGTYHLYYGDHAGSPGTILTFFPWENAAPGRHGAGQSGATAFIAPKEALGWWTHRLIEKGVAHGGIETRFGESVLPFRDPDGGANELIFVTDPPGVTPWTGSDAPADMAIRGFHGVTLWSERPSETGRVLTEALGFTQAGVDGARRRFVAPGRPGGVVDVLDVTGSQRGTMGAGVTHHVAFRASDDASQSAMATIALDRLGLSPTPQVDRTYFRSVYFREPGGVLFEIATDDPGFAIDEPMASLGEALMLPQRYEANRAAIEAALPALD